MPHTTHLFYSRYSFAFWVILALAIAVRSIALTRPLVGNFSTKNVVYAMIARNWAEGRSGMAFPTLDCLRDGQRSFHMLEFPVSAYLTGFLWQQLGGSLDVWGRVTSVGFSGASLVVLFGFVRRRHGRKAALAAAMTLALAPVSIVYGQSFMLEASLVFFVCVTFDAVDRWLESGQMAWLAVGSLALALLLLTKIYMLVLLLPLATEILCPRQAVRSISPRLVGSRRSLVAMSAFTLAIVPAAWWYVHAYQTADPQSETVARIFYSIRQSTVDHALPHPLWISADFYRQILDDLSGVVLTPLGLVLAMVGILSGALRRYLAWIVAMLILVVVLPRKFYEMNYYYMAVLPLLCILVGLGWRRFHKRLRLKPVAVGAIVLLTLAFSLRYAYRPGFVTPAEDRAVVEAGRAVRDLTSKDDPVLTLHGSSIDLLYYCNRSGWAVESDDPRFASHRIAARREGANYLVVVDDNESLSRWIQHGRLIEVTSGEGYVIYALGPTR